MESWHQRLPKQQDAYYFLIGSVRYNKLPIF